MQDPTSPPSSEISAIERVSLIAFPSFFPIKVMGRNVDALIPTLCAIALEFDPAFEATGIELRTSKAGNYMGVTLNITASSQSQLDALYTRLSKHPLVKVVL